MVLINGGEGGGWIFAWNHLRNFLINLKSLLTQTVLINEQSYSALEIKEKSKTLNWFQRTIAMEDSKSEGIVMDRTGITTEEYVLGVMTRIIPLYLNFML